MKEYYKCESIRLCRYLYSLGFNKISKFDSNKKEYWLFERSNELQNALSFFFSMRKTSKFHMILVEKVKLLCFSTTPTNSRVCALPGKSKCICRGQIFFSLIFPL